MKYLLILFTFLFMIVHSSCFTCSDQADAYRKVEFDMKIEKMPNFGVTRNITIEGKDKNGKLVRWQDFHIWLNNNSNKLFIGDSIKKEKGELLLIIKNNATNNIITIPFDCGNEMSK